jgi:hypothetical protein
MRAYFAAIGLFDALDRVQETQAARVAAAEKVGSMIPTTPAGLAAYASYVRRRLERHAALTGEPLPHAELWPLMTLETAASRLSAGNANESFVPASDVIFDGRPILLPENDPTLRYDDDFDDNW